MARLDFAWVNFDEAFDASNTEQTRNFNVESPPVAAHAPGASPNARAEGYILVQARDVEQGNHQIEINGQDLPSFDIPIGGNQEWQTWMDRIPSGFLDPGPNRLTIRRIGQEDFFVANVAVHWREQG